MCNFVKELNLMREIDSAVLAEAITKLISIRKKEVNPGTLLYLVVDFENVVEGKFAIKEYTECTNPVQVILKPVDFLKAGAWFLTDGESAIWMAGF